MTMFFATIRLTENSSEFMLVFLIIIASFFVYRYLYFFAIQNRRALLEYYVKDSSGVKRLLWHSYFLSLRTIFISIFLAFTIIMTIAKSDGIEIAFLLASIVIFKLIYTFVSKNLNEHLKPISVKHNSLRSSYYLNLILISVTLSSYQLLNCSFEDFTSYSFIGIVNKEFSEAKNYNNGFVPYLFAYIDIGKHFILSLLENITNSKEFSTSSKVFIWIFFLLSNAVQLVLFWLILLGTQTLINDQRENGWKILGDGVFLKQFTITLVVLFFVLLSFLKLAEIGTKEITNNITATEKNDVKQEAETQQNYNTCDIEYLNNQKILEVLIKNADTKDPKKYFERIIDNRINALNSLLEQNVDQFLDWHFSVKGQYTELGYLAASAIDSEQLNNLLKEKLYDSLSKAIDDKLSSLHSRLKNANASTLENYINSQDIYIQQLSFSNDCYQEDAMPFYDVKENSILLTEIEAKLGGAAVAIVGLKFGSKAFAKALSTKIAAKLSANTLAKLAAKSSVSSSSAAAGLTCGPAVLVCSSALAVGAWLAVDFASVSVDEKLSREALKTEIMVDIHEHTKVLAIELKDQYTKMITSEIQEVNNSKLQIFQPAMKIFND